MKPLSTTGAGRAIGVALLFTLFSFQLLHARGDEKKIKLVDRFGNEAAPEPDLSNQHSAANPIAQAGYYELMFEDVQNNAATGFNDPVTGQARRDVAVQVFTDLSQLIVPANHPYTGASNMNQPLVKIKIASWTSISPAPPANALGVGSAYYTIIYGNTQAPTGLIDGAVFTAINGGINPYLNFNDYGMYVSNPYHGYLAINLTNYTFSTNLSNTTAAGEYDLYSVMLHESMHTLGFNSLISSNGTSILNFTNLYSRYDYFLHTANGTPLVTITDGCYNTGFNATVADLTPPAGCANGITFNGTQTHPVYGPAIFENGSSLSHLDGACPPNINYVMTAAQGTGPSSMKRKPTTAEVIVLHDLGYETTNTFGTANLVSNTSLPNTYSYSTAYAAGGERVGGVNDFYEFANQYHYYSGVGGVPATYTDFLQDDENATHFICLEDMTGNGTLSNVTGTSFTYTPSLTFAASAAVLEYIPVSASGKKGNRTYMLISVIAPPLPTCPAANCNLVCNGDFEAVTNKFASPLGNFQVTQGTNSPDLFINNTRVLDNATSSYMGCSSANFPYPHGGSKYVGIMGGPQPITINNAEGLNFPLNTPMMAGTTYQISFWAKNHSQNCPASIELSASAVAPCPMPYTTNAPPATTYCGYTYTPYQIASIPVSNVSGWTQFTYTYTPSVTCNYFMLRAQASGFFSYVFIDDVQIIETPLAVSAGSDTTICTGDVAVLNGNPGCTGLNNLAYAWSNASGPVGNTAAISVSPLTTTTYSLTVTDPLSGVSGTDVIIVTVQNCSTGMTENGAATLKVFPNPSDGEFSIYLPEEMKGANAEVKITNLLGETVYSKNTMASSVRVALPGIPKGVYLVSITSEQKVYTAKIILQ